jgi:MIP family channel proteins
MAKDEGGINIAAVIAEFLAMTLFILIGCGTACALPGKAQLADADEGAEEWSKDLDSAWVLEVGLAFGIGIMVLAYSIGHISGGEINGAVTIGLIAAGVQSPVQGIANIAAQLMGSVFGAVILSIIFSSSNDNTGGLGSNGVDKDYSTPGCLPALVAEIFGTFLLMSTVLQTAVNPKSKGNRAQACMAIGFSVALAHFVLVPIDGCSINPTRSFGPAMVASFTRQGRHNDGAFCTDHVFSDDAGLTCAAYKMDGDVCTAASDTGRLLSTDDLKEAVKAKAGEVQEAAEDVKEEISDAAGKLGSSTTSTTACCACGGGDRYGGFKKFFIKSHFWVFVVGPIIGAVLAAMVYKFITNVDSTSVELDDEEEESE